MSDSINVSEFIAGYLAEADEQLRAATSNLLAVEESLRRGEHNARAVRDLFRSLHTLKGLSAMVGAEPVVDLTHEMETILRAADRAGGRLPAAAIDVLVEGVRAVEKRVLAFGRGEPIPPAPRDLLAALASLQVEGAQPPPRGAFTLEPELVEKLSAAEQEQLLQGIGRGLRAVRVDFIPSPARAEQGISITTVRERASKLGELVKVLPRGVPVSEQAPGGLAFALLLLTDRPDAQVAEAASAAPEDVRPIAASPAPAPPVAAPRPAEAPDAAEERYGYGQNYVRVDVARLDETLDRLSALVVTRFRLQRAVADLERGSGDLRRLSGIVNESGRQLRDLRAAIMRTRMVPVAELLERAPLIVRGLSQSSGKPLRLMVDAGRAELDKAVGERLFPAVVHLLRNAADHAIEPVEERKRLGKPAEGRIAIRCGERSNNQLELSVSDDGRGIDRAAVARRANRPIPQTDAELFELIAQPGLSTVDQATTTSGRGLGMDIVRRIAVDELGGDVEVRSVPGEGTTFTLRVPLSVTIVDAFSFDCGGQVFVVPVGGVSDLAEVEPEALTRGPAPRSGGAAVRLLQHRGGLVPLVSLASVLKLPAGRPERPKAIIVRGADDAMAFEVDRLIGQQEVVVRPLTDPLVTVPGVTGATDLGDGRATLVVDLQALGRQLGQSAEVAP